MSKILAALAVLTMCSSAYANPLAAQKNTPSSTANQTQTTNSASDSVAAANNAGNQQSIVFTSPGENATSVSYSGSQTIRNVPSVSGPSLMSSNDTCMGSISGSVNVAGFGGGFGKTHTDANCVMLKNSRELWNMGMRAAALARMCMDADNKEALEMTGFECPQTTRARNKQTAVVEPVTNASLSGE